MSEDNNSRSERPSEKGGAGSWVTRQYHLISRALFLDVLFNRQTRPIFIYVRKSSLTNPAVKAFVDFYLENVKTLAAEVGYIPLSDATYAHVKTRLESGLVGSIFSGKSQMGVRLDQLLAGS